MCVPLPNRIALYSAPAGLPFLQLNVMSMAPITASQFGTNRVMQQLLLGKADGELTGGQKFASAAVAGGVSALIASPSELIIIQQQARSMSGVTWKQCG